MTSCSLLAIHQGQETFRPQRPADSGIQEADMVPRKPDQQPNRKPERIRRVNRVVQSRTFVLMLVLGVATFIALFLKLYQIQIKQHAALQEKAVAQQTRATVVTASRGTIYDRNGNIMSIRK